VPATAFKPSNGVCTGPTPPLVGVPRGGRGPSTSTQQDANRRARVHTPRVPATMQRPGALAAAGALRRPYVGTGSNIKKRLGPPQAGRPVRAAHHRNVAPPGPPLAALNRANRTPRAVSLHRRCKTRQDTWRIKRTRKGQRLTGKAPSKTMGAKTEGTRDVDGCDDAGKGREGSQGKGLSLELRLPLSIPPKELGSLDYVLSLGHLRCPRTCMRSSPHGAAP